MQKRRINRKLLFLISLVGLATGVVLLIMTANQLNALYYVENANIPMSLGMGGSAFGVLEEEYFAVIATASALLVLSAALMVIEIRKLSARRRRNKRIE